MRTNLVLAASLFLFPLASAFAQPPVGPDARPKPIRPEELSKLLDGPTLVTLKLADARPEAVFAELAKQGGFQVDAYESTDALKKLPAMSVDVSKAPCLVALRNLSAKLDLHFTFTNTSASEKNPAGMVLRLLPADDPQLRMQGPMLERGLFVVITTSVQRARTISLGESRPGAARADYWVDFVILADPKLRKYSLVGSPHFYGSDGWTIRLAGGEGVWSKRAANVGISVLEWRFTAHRRLGPPDAPKVPALKTMAEGMLVATKTETWKVPDILAAKNVSKEVTLAEGKRRYTIHEIKEIPSKFMRPRETWAVRLSIGGVGATKGKWSGWPELQPGQVVDSFRLLDDDGRDFAPLGAFTQTGGGYSLKDVTLSGDFWNGSKRGAGQQAEGRPAQALWTLPTEFRSIEIPLEFDKLPLP